MHKYGLTFLFGLILVCIALAKFRLGLIQKIVKKNFFKNYDTNVHFVHSLHANNLVIGAMHEGSQLVEGLKSLAFSIGFCGFYLIIKSSFNLTFIWTRS